MSTAEADARVGKLFDDRFQIHRKIGGGESGGVYLAEHPDGAQVALKIVERDGPTPIAVKRFLREIEVTRRLHHPHIVLVHEAGETSSGELYLAMELLKGRTLQRQLRQHGPMDAPRIVSIARQIAFALEAAHTQKVLHRDLKPANIRLIAREGSPDFVKVLDFAIARFMEDEEEDDGEQLTAVGKVVGTPYYMAPEQIANKALDARCDLYALGCILYEMATGRTPFIGRTFEVMRQHAFDRPPSPSAIAARPLPPALEQLIYALLAKEPADRPANARAVVEALDRIEAGEVAERPQGVSFGASTDDDSVPTSEPLTEEPGLSPTSLALAGFSGVLALGLLAIAVVGVGVFVWLGR